MFATEMNQVSNTPRIQWLDALKGILIFFVILSHSYPQEIYKRFFTPFFLTMFFFASGYTFIQKKSFKKFLKNKWKRLMQPFLILGGIRIVLSYMIEGGSLIQRIVWFVLQINCQGDEMWFISCLFSCSILFYGILILSEKIDDRYKDGFLLGSGAVGMALGMIDICVLKIKFVWEMEIACMMIFYMALGYFYRLHQAAIEKKFEKFSWIVFLAFIYMLGAFFVQNDVNIHAERFQYPIIFLMMSICAILPVIYVAKYICRSHKDKILSFLGRNTLFYYAFAGIVRIVFFAVFEYSETSYMQSIVCACLSVVVLAFPAWSVSKYLPWMVGKRMDEKDEKIN